MTPTTWARRFAVGFGWGVVAGLATLGLSVILVLKSAWWVIVLGVLGFWLL